MKTVCNELNSVKHRAYDIGIQLGFSTSQLAQFKQEGNLFVSVVDCWLRGNISNAPCSWKYMVEVLKSEQVGEMGLAGTLRGKYCGETTGRFNNSIADYVLQCFAL